MWNIRLAVWFSLRNLNQFTDMPQKDLYIKQTNLFTVKNIAITE